MARKIKHDLRLERIMNFVADSEFGLSDEELLAEIIEGGSNLTEEAEAASKIIREISQSLDALCTRLATLGHRISSAHWRPESSESNIECVDCGLIVRLDLSRGKFVGEALHERCCGSNQYEVARTGS